MRILIVGAGAVGGYFGSRLLEKGEDVTFLVRQKRKQQLETDGLNVKSVNGNMTFSPKMIVAGDEISPFDVVLLSTKAYNLNEVLADLNQYVDKQTVVLPVLNGVAHINSLQKHYGVEKVLGGLCFIESTLDQNGNIIQTSPSHDLVFGEWSGERTERIIRLEKAFSGTKANISLSNEISQEMWQKYLFITTFSGITTLTRSSIGPIREAVGGNELILRYANELISIMKVLNAPLAENIDDILIKRINAMPDTMKSSMQRDMEKGAGVEVDHLQGYLYQIAIHEGIDVPVLQTIYTNLKVYEQMKN